jgi:hypothetical protein
MPQYVIIIYIYIEMLNTMLSEGIPLFQNRRVLDAFTDFWYNWGAPIAWIHGPCDLPRIARNIATMSDEMKRERTELRCSVEPKSFEKGKDES